MTVVDLKRYPITEPAGAEGQALIADARRQIAQAGACHLPGFLSAEGLALCLAEAEALAPLAHASNHRLTPYYRPPDPSLPETDPKNMTVTFAVGYVAREDIPAGSPFRALFEGDELLNFLRHVLPSEPLYRYSEPRGSLNVTVMREGDELGWHFDACELVASILFRAGEAGGEFAYVPDVRSPQDANEPGVAAIVGGDDSRALSVALQPGDLLLFRGRHALHRVHPVKGDVPRLIGLMSFDNVERAPPNPANAKLMRKAGAA